MTCKSGIRTAEKVEAHNCPILGTCCYLREEGTDWGACGWFGGSTSTNPNMLIVKCDCPLQVLGEGEA